MTGSKKLILVYLGALLFVVFAFSAFGWVLASRVTLAERLEHDRESFVFALETNLAGLPSVEKLEQMECQEMVDRLYTLGFMARTVGFLQDREDLQGLYLVTAEIRLDDYSVPIEEQSTNLLLQWLEPGYDVIGIKVRHGDANLVTLPVFANAGFRGELEADDSLETTFWHNRVELEFGSQASVLADGWDSARIQLPKAWLREGVTVAVYDKQGNVSNYERLFINEPVRVLLEQHGD